MMKRMKLVVVMLLTLILLLTALPAAAITDGELDGNAHPHVVLVVAELAPDPDTGDFRGWRCSGTMLSDTVVLTAGHCVSNSPVEATDPVLAMRIFIESDVQAGIGTTNDYPYGDGTEDTAREAASWAAHPLYDGNAFFLHDVGVVVLAEPFAPGVYGTLPAQDSLDGLKPGPRTGFTSVGYGLQRSSEVPFLDIALRTRMVAHPILLQNNTGFTGDFSLLLSNNTATGGTCFGDSGGPNFLGDDTSTLVAGVTSYGLNGACGGTGGVFRLDRANVLEFVTSFLDADNGDGYD